MSRPDYLFDAPRGLVIGKRGKPVGKGHHTGYVIVTRRGNHVGMAHRMIWESVYGPIPEGLQINHINGDKTDNRLENLDLVTQSENILHAYRLGLMRADGPHNGRAIGKSRRAQP